MFTQCETNTRQGLGELKAAYTPSFINRKHSFYKIKATKCNLRKSIEDFFSMFTQRYLNTRQVGRTLESYTNPRRGRRFVELLRILPNPPSV